LVAGFVAAVVLAVTDGFFFAASFFILLLVRGINFATFFRRLSALGAGKGMDTPPDMC